MKILIADDHPLTLQGTKSFVESYKHTVIDTCSNGISALNYIQLHSPEVAILDINMPGLDGLDVARRIHEERIKTKVILLTMHKEMTIYKKAKKYNIYGYILKEHSNIELEKCLKEVKEGRCYVSEFLQENLIVATDNSNVELSKLSLSERKIVELIAQQKTSKQIAKMLFLSEKTIEGHRRNIIEKLGLPKEKNTLLVWAIQNVK
ncbi:response regulator transcription factor [Flavobacterium sp. SUN046]|uniref:response regulator transcription factor n=1 Tax=Flavobacterium sp. SUN046 TaxID=3002440 RepID=UPI002DBFDEF4|nr:response regulator transcription factor [Flavobacterium sp. SUN046]MEC4048830.1 response regulator transcription factor [Flavobacterium sp. SUN046]